MGSGKGESRVPMHYVYSGDTKNKDQGGLSLRVCISIHVLYLALLLHLVIVLRLCECMHV